ncbi:MAG: DEAD/DEAH box helicase, partial [Nanoarchaeota archaeon]
LEFTQSGKGIQSLVLVPTRELAKQVEKEMIEFSKYAFLNIYALTGGKTTNKMLREIPEAEILIATPGKLLDILENFELDLSKVETLVLDEVDMMLDKDFLEPVKKIIEQIPRKRQNMFFSATLPKEVIKVAHIYMKKPVKITANFYLEPKKLKQLYYPVEPDKKLSLLVHLLKTERAGLSLVFTNREQIAKFLEKNLKKNTNLEIKSIVGEMPAGKRKRIIDEFRQEKFDVLIATDLAARGLDVESITHVYNYNIPKEPDKYIHRIGRTARAENKGIVINFITENEIETIGLLLKTHDIHLLRKNLPEFDEIEVKEIKKTEKRHKRRN